MENNICHIPVVGHMTKGPDGEYYLNEEASTWADIPAETIAAYLVDKLGVDAIFNGEASA